MGKERYVTQVFGYIMIGRRMNNTETETKFYSNFLGFMNGLKALLDVSQVLNLNLESCFCLPLPIIEEYNTMLFYACWMIRDEIFGLESCRHTISHLSRNG